MIIYNSNKKLVGIDAGDLKTLGFKSLAALQTEAADFADLFVKTPGHVHNFKHVHWIDFVLCAKSTQESKAIIHANDKNFKVNLEVKTFYLSDSPSEEAFLVNLNSIRNLSSDEKTEIATELQTRVAPSPAPLEPIRPSNDEPLDIDMDDFDDAPNDVQEIVDDPYAVVEDEVVDIYEPSEEDLANIGEAEVETDDYYKEEEEEEEAQPEVSQEIEVDIEEDFDDDMEEFTFDPQKTAEALEMPISLIEEFIEDFIAQAKEFKNSLYTAVEQDDMIELQAYSHKLKGVAANLRVNDALDILSKINKSKDFTTSKRDLDVFYRIISKLAGEKIVSKKSASIEDDHVISIDEEEPSKIELSNISIDEDDELLEIVEDDFDKLEIVEDDLDAIEIDMDEEEEEEDDIPLIISDDFDILDDAMNDTIEESELNEDVVAVQSYSKKSAASDIGIDDDNFSELFDDYVNESQILIDSMDGAIFNNIAEVWIEAAIKLKGMSDNMRIGNFSTDLEVLITTKDADEAKSALTNIQSAIFEIIETKD